MRTFMQKFYEMKPAAVGKIVRENDGSVEKIFRYFKRRSVAEAEGVEEVVEVDEEEDEEESKGKGMGMGGASGVGCSAT